MIWWVAAITMVIDHAGALFWPEWFGLRLVGRLSYPLYGYLLAMGLQKTANKKQYLKRLILLAIVSEPIHFMAFSTWWSPVAGLATAAILVQGGKYWGMAVAAVMVVAGIDPTSVMIPASWIADTSGVVPSLCIFAMSIFFSPWLLIGLCTVPIIYMVGDVQVPIPPRLLKYILYPAHLMLMLGIRAA